jgi:hypothetical protein
MRPITLSLCLMLIIGLLSSVAVGDYLYNGEELTGSEEFTALGSTYEIVSVDGAETFLLKDGEILDDKGEIEAALYHYYLNKYYPTESEISNLSALLELYHASRENGDMWEGVEEEECRMAIFLHAFPCTNDTIPETFEESRNNDCYLTASILCDEYGDYFGCSDPIQIMPMVQDFAISSNRMTEIHNRTAAALANLSESNIYSVFSQLKDDIKDMRGYEEKLEKTQLRVPFTSEGDKCNSCYGMCPPIVIDEEYLDEAEEMVDEMLPELAYIDDYQGLAQQVYNSTIERAEQHTQNVMQEEYAGQYVPQKERAEGVLAKADTLLEHISDTTVLSNSGRVRQVMETIESGFNSSDLGGMEANFAELDAKLNILEASISSSWEIYNATVKAKERADALFFTLETEELSESAQAEYAALKAEKRTQDRSFVNGLSPEKYAEITETYNSISERASALLESVQESGLIVESFKGAGRKTNEGIADLTATMAPMEREEEEEISGYAPLVVSSLSFFSLSSLAVFVFLFALTTFSDVFRNKMALFLGILLLGCSILFAGVVSGGIYFVLSSSSTDASFSDFQSYVLSSPHVSIMVETEGVPSGAASKMMSCAGSLSDSLAGKDVQIYERINGECMVSAQNVTLAECYNTVEEPIILLKYSTVEESPEFMTGFVYKATFFGDEEYFNQCALAKGFVQTDISQYTAVEEPPESNETGANATN